MHSVVYKEKVFKSIRTPKQMNNNKKKRPKKLFPKSKNSIKCLVYSPVIFWDTVKISHGTLHLKTNKQKKTSASCVYLVRNDNVIKLNQPDDDL